MGNKLYKVKLQKNVKITFHVLTQIIMQYLCPKHDLRDTYVQVKFNLAICHACGKYSLITDELY